MTTDDPRRTVVFDLDGTLVHGDVFTALRHDLMGRQWWRRVLARAVGPVRAVLLRTGPRTRRLGVALELWIGTVGVAPSVFAERAAAVSRAHAAPSRRIVPALDRLAAHRHRGDRVVVASASPQPLVGEVCAQLGLGDVVQVAARLERRHGAYRVATECRGAAKVARLQDAGITAPYAVAYTDAAIDLPLLRCAQVAVLVEPTARTLRIVARDDTVRPLVLGLERPQPR